MSAAGREAARERLRPSPELDARIQAHLRDQLGGVLPPDPDRGLGWYHRWVVLGERSEEALDILAAAALPPGPLVDVGAGLGTFVLLARLRGFEALGVEPGDAERELAAARAREVLGADGPLVIPGFGEALPLEDGTAAAVLLHDVLEHVGDWRAVLRETHRVLAPGGVLYVKGPSYAVRFQEPHYRVPWLPLLPRPVARRYLRALGRDVGYFEHLGYRRRGEVLAELGRLGFSLSFPRLDKLRDPARVNRPWARRIVELSTSGPGRPLVEALAESPLQSTIDVLARKP